MRFKACFEIWFRQLSAEISSSSGRVLDFKYSRPFQNHPTRDSILGKVIYTCQTIQHHFKNVSSKHDAIARCYTRLIELSWRSSDPQCCLQHYWRFSSTAGKKMKTFTNYEISHQQRCRAHSQACLHKTIQKRNRRFENAAFKYSEPLHIIIDRGNRWNRSYRAHY